MKVNKSLKYVINVQM